MTDKPIAIRLDEETLTRLDRIATALTGRVAGARLNRTDAHRVALLRGIESLEEELALQKKKKR
jgi:predicted transcriptional regulator